MNYDCRYSTELKIGEGQKSTKGKERDCED